MMSPHRKSWRDLRTTACCFIIGGVSLIDTWLIVRHAEIIQVTEENPVGRMLLTLGNGDVSLFVACKLLGTVVVLTSLFWLSANYWLIAQPVIRCITVFQTWLLWYLCISEKHVGYTERTKLYLVIVIAAICLMPFVRDRFSARVLIVQLQRAIVRMVPQRRMS